MITQHKNGPHTAKSGRKLGQLPTDSTDSGSTLAQQRLGSSSGKPNSIPHVAVLVDTSTGWGRRLVRGINNYAVKHGPWRLWIEPRGREVPLSLPVDWDGQGVIARLSSNQLAEDLKQRNCSLVNVSVSAVHSSVPTVVSNFAAMGELAVQHFRERGLKNFAYVGPLHESYVQRHARAYDGAVAKQGYRCDTYDCVHESMMATPSWLARRERMGAWLKSLPKPVGIFSWGTSAASQLLDVCHESNIAVPDDVAILAGDDDDLICNTTVPSLSAMLLAAEQIGYEAARNLDAIMKGGAPPESTIKIDPIQVTARQSTDSLAIDDPELLAAIRFIRLNACLGITVKKVADSVPMGRRSLERKFKERFGCTPLDEIQRLRLGRVRELLVKTDLAVSKIAKEAGFGTPEYMTTMFKSRFGVTPLKFRSRSRAR